MFANALQVNRNDAELWQHYLTMYSRRGDRSQLLGLCQQALKYCPTYNIYWKVCNLQALVRILIKEYIKN